MADDVDADLCLLCRRPVYATDTHPCCQYWWDRTPEDLRRVPFRCTGCAAALELASMRGGGRYTNFLNGEPDGRKQTNRQPRRR